MHFPAPRDVAREPGGEARRDRAQGSRGLHAVGRRVCERDGAGGLDRQPGGRGLGGRGSDQGLHAERHGHIPGSRGGPHRGGPEGDSSAGRSRRCPRRGSAAGSRAHGAADCPGQEHAARLRSLPSCRWRGLGSFDAQGSVSAYRRPGPHRACRGGRSPRSHSVGPRRGTSAVGRDLPALPRIHAE